MLIRRANRMLKPGLGASLNYGHPIAGNLVACWLLNEHAGTKAYSLINRNDALTLLGASKWVDGNDLGAATNIYMNVDGDALQLTSPSAALKPTTAVSLFVRWHNNGGGNLNNNPSIAGMTYTSSNTSPFYAYSINRINGDHSALYAFDSAGGTNNAISTSGLMAVGVGGPYDSAIVVGPKSGKMTHYFKGRSVNSSARSGSLVYGSPEFVVGSAIFNSQASQINADVCYVWNRELSPAENQWLHEEPYAMLDWKKPRVLYFVYLPAQTLSLTGIASAEAFGSATMNVQKRLSPGGIASAEAFGVPHLVFRIDTFPGGIASAQAFGTPNMDFSQAISAAGIGPTEAFGSLHVTKQQFIGGSGIASAESVPKPLIGNDAISPTGIGTCEAFGLPVMNVQKRISPSGIASAEIVSSGLTVRNTLTISPTGISSAEAFGTASVKGGAKKLNMPGIVSAEAFGIPLIGGNTGLRIFIAGKDATLAFQSTAGGENIKRKAGLLRAGGTGSSSSTAGSATPLTMASQTIGRWSVSFDLIDYDTTIAPEMGQTVLVLEPGYRHFAGCLTVVKTEQITNTNAVIIHCTARDKSAILDRRVCKTPSYPAGMDIADVVRDIWTNYLGGEGITVNGVPATLGALINDFVLPGQLPSVTNAYDALAVLFGGVWFIDSYCDLHFGDTSILPASPFTVDTSNTRGPTVTTDSKSYATAVYAVSNLNVKPGFSGSGAPPVTGVSLTETFTLPQASAVARGFLFGAIITQFPIRAITSLKVNGVAQGVYLGTDPYNFRHSWWYFPGVPYITPPNVQNTNPFPDPPTSSSDPMTGDVVEVQYIPISSTASVDSGGPLSPSGGTCGSGIWEKVIQAQNIQFQGDLSTIAAAQLSLYSQIPKLLEFETDYPGLTVGMKLSANFPRLGLASATLLITSINATSQHGVDIGHGSCFRWQVQAYNTADPGNDLKFWERVIQRTEMAAPLSQPILPTIILAAGTSLGGGTVSMVPLIVGVDAQVNEIAVACEQGPVNQDMYIDLIDSASGSLLAQPMKIPAGTAAGAVLTFSNVRLAGGTWIYQNETITPTVTYVAAGVNPVAASGVAIQVRGTF